MPSRFEWPFRFFILLVSMLHIYTVQVLLKKKVRIRITFLNFGYCHWRWDSKICELWWFNVCYPSYVCSSENSWRQGGRIINDRTIKRNCLFFNGVVWNTEVFVVFLPPLFGPQTLAECLQSLGWTSLKVLFISCMPILIILNYFTCQEK